MKPPVVKYLRRFSRSGAVRVKPPSPDQTLKGVLNSASDPSWTGMKARAVCNVVSSETRVRKWSAKHTEVCAPP